MEFDVARVRGLYPALGDGWVYLDPHEGAQIPGVVGTAVATTFRRVFTSAGARSQQGSHARALVGDARRAFADVVGGHPAGVVLAPGRVQLLETVAEALSARIWLGSRVVLSRIDDEPNIVPWQRVADRAGAEIAWAEPDIETSEVPDWQFAELVTRTTSVVAITLASSVVGTVINTVAAAQAAHAVGALLVVDATSVAGHEPLDIAELGADVLIVSAERWGGPRVAAAVFADPTLIARLRPTSLASDDTGPERLETGEYPYALLAGAIASVEHLAGLGELAQGSRRERVVRSLSALRAYEQQLLGYLIHALTSSPKVMVCGSAERRVPVVSFAVDGVAASKVAARLDEHRIATTADIPSRFFDAVGISDMGGAVTVGLSPYSTPYDVDQLVRTLGAFL